MANSITLLGRLGRDPEMKFLPNGTGVCNFSLATSEKWKDKTTGEAKEQTQWHKIVAWGKQAETLRQYLKKGDRLFLTGTLKYSEWNDKEGNKRVTAEIHVDTFEFLGNKSDGNTAAGAQNGKAANGGFSANKGMNEEDIPF